MDRGMGVCAITGCNNLNIDYKAGTATTGDGQVIKRGDIITLDGIAGEVMLGDIPKIVASSSDDFQTTLTATTRSCVPASIVRGFCVVLLDSERHCVRSPDSLAMFSCKSQPTFLRNSIAT